MLHFAKISSNEHEIEEYNLIARNRGIQFSKTKHSEFITAACAVVQDRVLAQATQIGLTERVLEVSKS